VTMRRRFGSPSASNTCALATAVADALTSSR
jgi:hypothetical protein